MAKKPKQLPAETATTTVRRSTKVTDALDLLSEPQKAEIRLALGVDHQTQLLRELAAKWRGLAEGQGYLLALVFNRCADDLDDLLVEELHD
jgi:hypothetical protein